MKFFSGYAKIVALALILFGALYLLHLNRSRVSHEVGISKVAMREKIHDAYKTQHVQSTYPSPAAQKKLTPEEFIAVLDKDFPKAGTAVVKPMDGDIKVTYIQDKVLGKLEKSTYPDGSVYYNLVGDTLDVSTGIYSTAKERQ